MSDALGDSDSRRGGTIRFDVLSRTGGSDKGPGEWFYDAPSGKLYLRLADDTDPTGHVVEIVTEVSGIVSTADHVVLDGLAVRGAGAHGIELSAPNGVRVRNCRVEDAGHHGIFVDWPPAGAVVAIDDNTVLRANFTGIMVSADTETAQQVKLRRNHVEDTAPSFPMVSDAAEAAGYSWGFGMALHVYGQGVEVEGNTVVNADFGIQLHNTQNDDVRGNVIYDCRNAGIHVSENGSTTPGFCRDNRVEQNVVIAARQVPAIVESYDMGWFVDYASYDANRYWHEQGHKPFVRNIAAPTSSYDAYSLDEWQAATGYDSSSVDLAMTYQVVPFAGRPTGASNLIANGTFDADVAGWGGWPDAVTVVWSADGGLDGGCLSATASGAGDGALVSSPAFVLAEGQGYLLRFTVRSGAPQALSAVVRLNESPWSSLGLSALWSAGAEPSDYTLPFVGTMTAEGRLDLTTNDDFAFFLDDVDLREAEILENDRADDLRILLNTTSEPQSFELGAAPHCDLDEQELTGTVAVPAFGSLVLTSCQCNADAVCNNHETAASCAADCP